MYHALLLMLLTSLATLAQTVDCPTIVQQALAAADEACLDTGRNQACYGNIVLAAKPQPGAQDFTFDQAGDQVNLELVKSLALSPMDTAANTWGVALLKVQANLADTLPGQNVTFLMFGDVTINNAQTIDFLPIPVAGISVTSTPHSTPTAEALAAYGPMQAFYFRTGARDAPCTAAPDSGILIQTPKGAGQIELLANEVRITLGSTVYLQAQPGGDMLIHVLEGQATVTALGVTVTAPAGTRVRVPLDNNLTPSGPPTAIEALVPAEVVALPISHLPDVFTVAAPLTAAQIAALPTLTPTANVPSAAAQGGLPISGQWCPTATGCNNGVLPSTLTFTVEEDGAILILGYEGGADRYTRSEPGVYFWTDGSNEAILRVLSPTHITIEYTFAAGNSFTADWTLLEGSAAAAPGGE